MTNYDNSNCTEDWKKYFAGVQYNQRLKPNYYQQIDCNLAMFNGDQWRNLKSNKMSQPVFNIIARTVKYFIASLTSNKSTIVYQPLAFNEENPDEQMQLHKSIADIATAEVSNLFDKFKMDNRIRDALFDGSTMGDFCAHMYFDPTKKPYGGAFPDVKGELCFELIDGTNVFLGNPNNPSTDTNIQPYIVISGRDMTDNLKREAKAYKQSTDNIVEDKDYTYQAGDMSKIEIESDDIGKSLYIIVYRYDIDSGTVKVSKCTKNAYMYKDIDTGLNYYPVPFGNWEKQKNQQHGKSMVTDVIPNQIFINRMFSMVFYHLTNTAFPKMVYNADKISGISNEIGTAIGLRNLAEGESIKNLAGYLEVGQMSTQIVQAIELAISYTKECLGISDAAMGDISNPDNYRAIAVSTENSKVPLENIRANLYEWIEEIGKILLDMMGTYYGTRPIVIDGQMVEFDFAQLKNIYLKTKCEVGATTYFSEISSVETLNNLLKGGFIEIIDYLESLPDSYLNNKQGIIDSIKKRMEVAMPMGNENGGENIQPDQPIEPDNSQKFEEMAQFVDSLPQELQDKLQKLPDSQYEQIVTQLMEQASNGMNNQV